MLIKTIHGMKTFKIIDTKQAKIVNNFKIAKEKLLKTKAAIWFSKICKMNHLTLKTEGHNQQSRHTKPAVTSVFS